MRFITKNTDKEVFVGLDLGSKGRLGFTFKQPESPEGGRWVDVDSTMINQVYYARDSQALFVRFKNGSLYEYSGVPFETYKDLIHAESVGRFFNENVKTHFTGELFDD